MLRSLPIVLIFALALPAAAAEPAPHAAAPPTGSVDAAGPAGSGALKPVGADAAAVAVIVDGVEAYYKEVTDFKAGFTQVVQRAHLPRPLKKTGNVYFKAPGMMRWDYLQPERVYYVSDGEVLWSYEAATKQAIKMGIKNSELYDSLKFLFGQGNLRDSFEISLAELPPTEGADARAAADPVGDVVALKLIPRAGQNNYKSLTLFTIRGRWEIVKTELVDPLDNVSTITFEDATYGVLKAAAFKFKPPQGATVKDLLGSATRP